MVSGPQGNQIPSAQLRDGDLDLGAVGIAPPRPGGRQIQQLAQGARGPRTRARFQPMPQADEGDDGRGLHEIDVAAGAAE
ncbi:MAG: hypothetical protein NT167_13130 [Verrucomicrobia bacterium]|nr:hypothetical protein [Verrucomicrobiota bacterium]